MSHKNTIESVCDILNGNTFHPATTCTATPSTPAQLVRDQSDRGRRLSFQACYHARGIFTDGTMFFHVGTKPTNALRKALDKACTYDDAHNGNRIADQCVGHKRPSQRVRIIGESAKFYLLGDKHDEPVCAVSKTKFATILKWADGVDASTDIYADNASSPIVFGDTLAVVMPVTIEAKYTVVTPARSLSDTFQRPNVATVDFGKYKIVDKRKTSTAVIRVDGLSVSVLIDVRDGDYCAWLPYGGGAAHVHLIERSSRKEIEATLTELA